MLTESVRPEGNIDDLEEGPMAGKIVEILKDLLEDKVKVNRVTRFGKIGFK